MNKKLASVHWSLQCCPECACVSELFPALTCSCFRSLGHGCRSSLAGPLHQTLPYIYLQVYLHFSVQSHVKVPQLSLVLCASSMNQLCLATMLNDNCYGSIWRCPPPPSLFLSILEAGKTRILTIVLVWNSVWGLPDLFLLAPRFWLQILFSCLAWFPNRKSALVYLCSNSMIWFFLAVLWSKNYVLVLQSSCVLK